MPGARRSRPTPPASSCSSSTRPGAVVKDAEVTVINDADRRGPRGDVGRRRQRDVPGAVADRHLHGHASRSRASATKTRGDITLRAGETATLKVKLLVGSGEDRSHRLRHRRRACAPTRRSAAASTARRSTRRRSSAARSRRCRCSTRRSARARAPATCSSTPPTSSPASGSRRTTTFMLDGASNDEGWGRQTMLATVPLGAVQEVAVLSNAFSAEFGWTAGPALNIVTKSGTNALHGEGLYLGRPGGWQAKTFSTDGFCPPSVSTLHDAGARSTAINPADTAGRAEPGLRLDRRADRRRTRRSSSPPPTTRGRIGRRSSRPTLPAFVLPADGSLDYVGHYRQELFNARVDHKLTPAQTLMVRVNFDHFYDTNPERRRRRHQRADRRAPVHARRLDDAGQPHGRARRSNLLNEARVAYLNGDPVTLWEAQELSTTYTRAGSVPFTIGESRSSDIFGHQFQFADTLSWSRGRHTLRFGGSVDPPHLGRHRQRAGPGDARHVHVPQHDDGAVRAADAGRRAAVHAADQLRHHQLRAEAVDVGGVRAGQLPRAATTSRRRRPSLRPADADRRDDELRAAPRLRLASRRRRAHRRSAAATGCTTRRSAPTRSPAR